MSARRHTARRWNFDQRSHTAIGSGSGSNSAAAAESNPTSESSVSVSHSSWAGDSGEPSRAASDKDWELRHTNSSAKCATNSSGPRFRARRLGRALGERRRRRLSRAHVASSSASSSLKAPSRRSSNARHTIDDGDPGGNLGAFSGCVASARREGGAGRLHPLPSQAANFRSDGPAVSVAIIKRIEKKAQVLSSRVTVMSSQKKITIRTCPSRGPCKRCVLAHIRPAA